MMTVWNSKFFYGNEISKYGQENGYIDYATLAKAFDAVLNNNIIPVTGWENWEQESGFVDNSDEIERLEEEWEYLEQEQADEPDTEGRIEEIKNRLTELEDEQDEQPEIFQYYIVSDNGARILEDDFNEIVFYNSDLDMYVWGVTHYGTSWDYVLTDVKLNLNK